MLPRTLSDRVVRTLRLARHRMRLFFRRHSILMLTLVLLFALASVYFANRIFYNVPSGDVGVLWLRFQGGTVTGCAPVPEGLHVKAPWDEVFLYDGRVQIGNAQVDVLSADGLKLHVDLAYRFELDTDNVGVLHQFVGPDYVKTMVQPEVAADARDVLSQYTPEQIYTTKRKDIEKLIASKVNDHLLNGFNPKEPDGSVRPRSEIAKNCQTAGNILHFVKIEDVLAKSITLPPTVEAAIDSKNQQQQLAEEYTYRLERETQEAKRKQIEARGIKAFQDIVSPGLTDSYLRWRGIEATLELAKSPNAKIVIIGGGRSGLPLILGDGDTGRGADVSQTAPEPGAATPLGRLEKQLRTGAAALPSPDVGLAPQSK